VKAANVNGGSGEKDRGTWCTPKKWADRLGAFDLDAFSNPRSHIVAAMHLMLERGDDALTGPQSGYYWANRTGGILGPGEQGRTGCARIFASTDTRVFIQPPYEIVDAAIEHYGHTRFCALLRLDPSTRWFAKLYRITELVCVPRERLDFEPPPGVRASSNPYPHAFYFRNEADVPSAILRTCIAWRTR